MSNEANSDRLSIIANLLALQMTHDKSLVDSAWLLRKSGMKHSEIGQILGISEKAVGAHISNKKKLLEEATKRKTRRRVKDE